jgi:sulfate/thiosulfate transport system ATP-binding protein
MADVAFNEVDKIYDNGVQAVFDLTLDIHDGEFLVLVGPSGCGKTTALRMVAGLEDISDGTLSIGGRVVNDVSPKERDIAMVFQNYALYPHLSVAENIAFGLRSRPRGKRPDKAAIRRRVDELLTLIHLPDHGDRFPRQLSGGQKQRVALARALAIDPGVLLLDEPFGALDAKVRVELRRWLRSLHEQTGQTMLFVTHDQEEALELADRVVVMREGRIEQVGTPDEIYRAPASAYVFDFIGRGSRLCGQVAGGVFTLDGHSVQWPVESVANGEACLHMRPHDLALADAGIGVPARVLSTHRLADRLTVELGVEGQPQSLELDLVAAPDVVVPATGSIVGVQPLRYRAYPA